jgi:hypothetical protein
VAATKPGAPPESAPGDIPFRYVHSTDFQALPEGLGASLLVSTYQAGKLIIVRAAGGRLSTLLTTFDQPLGLDTDDRRLALGTRNAVWFLRNAPDLAPLARPARTARRPLPAALPRSTRPG